jgi:polysaccharide biosynthesis transport protein
VVESARVPRIVTGPLRKQWILLGFAFSLVLGVGLAILLEALNRTIQSTEDINRHLQLPALASIPTINSAAPRKFFQWRKGSQRTLFDKGSFFNLSDSSQNLALAQTVAADSHSDAAEAYRLLIASLTLSVEGSNGKTLLITSSQPGEGKTTTTINTAISLAQIGASVLVIDCDLRTPRVHERLGVLQHPGLTTYLSGKAELKDVVQQSTIQGLSVMTSGQVPSNPVRVINSRKMKDTLDELSQKYDHILIDSPPLLNLADPIILSTKVDGVILVVHIDKSDRHSVRRTRQVLYNVGANILGVVLNNITPRHIEYHNYT